MARQPDSDRAKRTLYVTGFNSKLIKKRLLKELFSQGGPVMDVTLFETHAYVLFQHVESVPYCLALFNDIEMFGDKLRLKPRSFSDGNPYTHLDYLAEVRVKLREEYSKIEPPKLPAKQYPVEQRNYRSRRHNHDRSQSTSNRSDSNNKGAVVGPDKARSPVSSKRCSSIKTATKTIKAPKAPTKSTSNTRRQKRGGRRTTVGNRKLQKKYKYIV